MNSPTLQTTPPKLIRLACVAVWMTGMVFVVALAGQDDASDDEGTAASESDQLKSGPAETTQKRDYFNEVVRGQVVWLFDALKEKEIDVVRQARENVLALKTSKGKLVPLVEDRRGHAFRMDERLRNRDVALYVRRYDKMPFAQVIRTYAVEEDGNYQLDYWCEVCAISMVVNGPCDCCQAANELRLRRVDEKALDVTR